MIGSFIKKDLLVLIRNPQNLLVLLCMPLVLIAILGFALGGVMSGDTFQMDAKVAWVDRGNEDKDIVRFNEKVNSLNLPDEAKSSLIEAAEQLRPLQILKEDVFGNEELKGMIEIVDVPSNQLDAALQNQEYSAIIEVPEHFTYGILSEVFLQDEAEVKINLYRSEGQQMASGVIEEILTQFQKQFSAMSVIGSFGLDYNSMAASNSIGEMNTLSGKEPISAMAYYTVGMCVMFIMFIASNMSSYAFVEKEQQVFNRIILSNVSRWSYLSGIFLSVMLIAILQQTLLYLFAAFVYQIHWGDVFPLILINFALSFAVGGMAALLTAINYRFNSEAASNFFGSVIVAVFAFLGGSFTPIADLSPVINFLGNLTPNGAGMNSLLQLLQGEGLASIGGNILYLFAFGVMLLIAAAASFPKRGELY